MPHLPESTRLWLERAEIDYIGPFVKAWAAFNAWYREASGMTRDAEGLRYVKSHPNPVRGSIKPLLQPAQTDGHGNIVPDHETAQKFRLLIRELHVCLDAFHIEVTRDDVVERISFRAVCLGRGPNLPQSRDHNRLRYQVDRTRRCWTSTVCSAANPTDIRASIEQATFDIDGLQGTEQFVGLSPTQRACLLTLYRQCNPRPFTDLLVGDGDRIIAHDIEFRCTDEQLFSALIEVIYAMRNALLHGELQPHGQAFAAYEPAYRIVIWFLGCLQR